MATEKGMAEPSQEQVLEALRRSGYLMEQEVASTLEALGFHVETNWAYEDVDEGKSREMDVRAVRRVGHNEQARLSAFIEIIVECKQNTSNPLVLVLREKNARDRASVPEEYLFPVPGYEMRQRADSPQSFRVRTVSPFFHLGLNRVHFDSGRSKKAVQFCQIGRFKGGWRATHGGLYDGLFYPLAKAVQARKQEVRPQGVGRPGDWRYFWFIVPVVIVSGQVYSVDSSQTPPRLEAVDFMTFKRELRSRSLKGTYELDFVAQPRVGGFVETCIEPLAEALRVLTEENAGFVGEQNIPWVDDEPEG